MLRKQFDWLLVGLFYVASALGSAHASPSVVIEDSLWNSNGTTSLYLDTTHFGEPMLLVGTGRDSAGVSCLLRIRARSFSIIDTVYQGHHVPTVCGLADFDADGELDYAVGVANGSGDSIPYYALIITHGPDFAKQDTLVLPSGLRDLAIDTLRQELWLARVDVHSQVDSSTIIQYLSYISGHIGSWGFDLVPHSAIGDSLGGLAVIARDIDSDGQDEIVGVWEKHLSWWCSGRMSHVPAESRYSCGARILGPGQSTAELQSWLQLKADFGREQLYSLYNPRHFPMADLDGDGVDEVVYAWRYYMDERPYFRQYRTEVQIHRLSDGELVWTRPYPNNPYGPFTCIVYPLDGDSLPDVLISERSDWSDTAGRLLGVRGSDGDSLFAFAFRPIASAVTPAFGGSGARPDVVEVRGSWLYRWHLDLATDIGDGSSSIVPMFCVLLPNFPNPFNGSTRIDFSQSKTAAVKLTIFDVLGRKVNTLVEETLPAGDHHTVWDGKDHDGHSLASGVYFYRLQAEHQLLTRSMLLLK